MTPAGLLALLVLLVYVGSYWFAALSAREGSRGGRTAALVLASVSFLAAIPWVLFCWFAWAFQCDDSCAAPPTDHWNQRAGAWQWSALLALALAGLAFTALAVVFAARRSYAAAAVALVVAGACLVAQLTL